MGYVIIACRTLGDELNLVLHETGCPYTVIWVDSEYHLDPDKLRAKLQQEIDRLENTDTVLFAYGCCGNGLVGLEASTAKLVIPRTDDCISMVLSRPGERFERRKFTYFLTRGWMEGSKSILKEYDHALARYGEKRAQRLFDVMFKHYAYLMLIDTGAYDLQAVSKKAEDLARQLKLELIQTKGDTWLLRKLLTGPYDQDFCIVQRGGVVEGSSFGAGFDGGKHERLQ